MMHSASQRRSVKALSETKEVNWLGPSQSTSAFIARKRMGQDPRSSCNAAWLLRSLKFRFDNATNACDSTTTQQNCFAFSARRSSSQRQLEKCVRPRPRIIDMRFRKEFLLLVLGRG